MTNVLVPILFPPSDRNLRAIRRALDLIDGRADAGITVLHVNVIQDGEDVGRRQLREAVEREFGTIPANYVTKSAFIVEEAILEEAAHPNVTHVVISKTRRTRWQRALLELLEADTDIETFLRDRIHVELLVIE